MKYDVLIVGAGVIGGMLARELSRYKLNVALMEKENDKLQDVTDGQLLREELLDLEDVDALLEQVMKEAEESF